MHALNACCSHTLTLGEWCLGPVLFFSTVVKGQSFFEAVEIRSDSTETVTLLLFGPSFFFFFW